MGEGGRKGPGWSWASGSAMVAGGPLYSGRRQGGGMWRGGAGSRLDQAVC